MLLWGLVAGWVPSLRRGVKQQVVWLIFLSVALIKTLAVGSVGAAVEDVLGTNGDVVVQHLLAIVAAVNLLRFITLIADRPTRSYHVLLGLGVAVALIVLFTLARDGVHSSAEELLAESETSPAVVAYWLVLEAYLGTALCMGCLLLWRVSRTVPMNLLRVGFWLMCAGTALNALFAVYKSAYIIANAAGVELPTGLVAAISDAMLPTAGLLIVSGVLLPASSFAWELLGLRLSMRALAPLWRTMRETFPDVILYVSEKLPSADGVLATARLRLYRTLIEIRDGMLELRGYVPPETIGEAREFLADRGVHGDQAAVLAEACWIEVALRRRHAGMRPCPGEWASIPGGADEREEANWLSKVSKARRTSRYPARFADSHWLSPPVSSRSPAPTP
ncbi:MAB_1171c family putative transporter [Kibdelosporangium persicum]|uniref:DUF6545 domain-containing protein n=1 Tax=Kibdelosporangium persicum TaxID=2698649 RepID=A0ABX2F932_9PSEU|nr:MAB_1171c family putative transporter [Kibdelosporangium persicum]NRN67475.1 hypothetical protein [Kibdelosporangium persicum]